MGTVGTPQGPDLLTLGDEQLLVLFREQNCLAARDELVTRYLSFTRRFAGQKARRFRLSAGWLPDVEQCAAVALMEAMSRFDEGRARGRKFDGFLRLVLRARLLDFVKALWRFEKHYDRTIAAAQALRDEVAAASARTSHARSIAEGIADPAAIAAAREELDRLDKALEALTTTTHHILEHRSNGGKLSAVARELGISYDAARRRLRKAREQVAAAVKPDGRN
jgi:RNA polymerase sigma factor (sigma-70 family)